MPDQHLIPYPRQQPPPSPPQGGMLVQPAPYYPDYEPEETGTPLSHYLWVLRRHRWKIIAFVLSCTLATLVVSSRLTPIFQATATIDIDRNVPAGVLGSESTQVPYSWDADQFMATQVKLIQSDSVLRPVVHRLKLRERQPGPPLPVSTEVENAPVGIGGLNVTRPPNTYLLLISHRSPDRNLSASVANAVANSYIEHTYNIRYRSTVGLSSFMEKQLEELRAKMERSAAALAQFERELNVINPEEKTSILSSRLQQLNTEFTSAQADRVRKEAAYNSVRTGSFDAALASSQGEALRKLSERLFEAQTNFAQIKTHYGSNHPEHRKTAAQVSQLQTQLDETLRGILRRSAVEHAEALNREAMLKKTVDQTRAEFDRLNARSFEYQSLKRDAEADKKLYAELVQKIREAGINAGFQNNAVRLADSARPPLFPVSPNIQLNLVLAFLFSSLLAVGAAVLSDALDSTVRDPEQARRTLGADVIGSLPLVKPWRRQLALPAPSGTGFSLSSSSGTGLQPVASSAADSFSEAIRTLRNSILLGSPNGPLRSLQITSATPAEGKTTTAVHLALSHALQGLRTLLIDADLRRPGVHRLLGLSSEPGLADVLSSRTVGPQACQADAGRQPGVIQWRSLLLSPQGLPSLAVLPAGKPTRRAADLVGAALVPLLAEAAADFDLIVLDSPPLLGFPEPLQIAAAVDGVVLVTLAGQTTRKAVSSALDVLNRIHAHVLGLVLNEVTSHLSDGYYYDHYGHYGKYYKYYRHKNVD